MFLTVYLGPTPTAWRDAVRAHAAWLGLYATGESRRLPGGALVEFAWVHPGTFQRERLLRESDDWLLLTAFGDLPPGALDARTRDAIETATVNRPDNATTIAVHQSTGDVVAVVPPASPHPLLVAAAAGGHVLSDDLRLFRRLTAARLDERGLYALAQFGAIPAPLTLFREVRRVPNGHALRLRAQRGVDETRLVYRPVQPAPDRTGARAESRVDDSLGALLGQVPEPAALCFSGGVDSALLAARWRALGRGDLPLVNYAFTANDPESALAARLAEHLGFTMRRVPHDAGAVGGMLERIGRDYTFPFGDISTVPTNGLVRAVAGSSPLGTTVLEGTGADGAYGIAALYPWWRRVYAVPRPLRRLVAATYRAAQLWRLDGRPQQVLRFARKTVQLSLAHAVVAQNALEGIVLLVSDDLRREVAETVHTSIEIIAAGAEPAEQISWLDLIWVCAGRMAPKSFDPLRHAGLLPRYPYLEPPMLAVSASLPWSQKCAGGVPKAPLKALLARHVPREWVYRPKHGFTPPEQAILSSAAAQARLQGAALARGGPFDGLCDLAAIRRLASLAPHATLSSGVTDLLWVFLFTTAWLEQVPSGAVPAAAHAHASSGMRGEVLT